MTNMAIPAGRRSAAWQNEALEHVNFEQEKIIEMPIHNLTDDTARDLGNENLKPKNEKEAAYNAQIKTMQGFWNTLF